MTYAEDKIKQHMLDIFQTNEFARSFIDRDLPNLDFGTAFIKYRVESGDQFKHVLTIEEALKYEGMFTALIFAPIRPHATVGFHSTMTLMCYPKCYRHLKICTEGLSDKLCTFIDLKTGENHKSCDGLCD